MHDIDYEGWSNQETWYVNIRVKNNRQAYRLMLDGQPYTPEKVKSFVMNWARHIKEGREQLFEFLKSYRNVNWEELALEWNKESK